MSKTSQADEPTGLDKHNFSAYSGKYFHTHHFNICFGCSIETVLLSTHNIFLDEKKRIFSLVKTLVN